MFKKTPFYLAITESVIASLAKSLNNSLRIISGNTVNLIPLLCLLFPLKSFAEQECSKAPCEDPLASIYRNQITNTMWENNTTAVDFYKSPYQVSLFSAESGEDSERLWSQTKSVFAYGFGVIGVLYVLPESVTKWDKDGDSFIKWGSNVSDGPLWDRDNVPINWIGHPYFGSTYYQVARKSGYRQWDAFVYSFLMSTFYWEYGIEALAEIPSIQDIVITPVLGWAWGEWAFNQEQDILRDGGTVFGSDFLGSTALVLLDPIDSLGRGINNLFDHEVIKAGTGYISMKEVAIKGTNETESVVQLNVAYTFGSGARWSGNNAPSYYHNSKDPVDYGIIGLSFGAGYVDLDKNWNVDDGQTTEYSLGLYFSKRFSSRVSYSKAKLNDLTTGKKMSYENYSLNAQYYFNTEENFRPYITTGFGEMLREKDNELKTFQLHLGAGLHYKINNNFALQTDIRRYHSASTDTSENTISANVVYRLGKGEWH